MTSIFLAIIFFMTSWTQLTEISENGWGINRPK